MEKVSDNVREMLLFHGTRQEIMNAICQQVRKYWQLISQGIVCVYSRVFSGSGSGRTLCTVC